MPIGTSISQHADWHHYFTAGRLAPLFHSRPIGNDPTFNSGCDQATRIQTAQNNISWSDRPSPAMTGADATPADAVAHDDDGFSTPGEATRRLLGHHLEALGSNHHLCQSFHDVSSEKDSCPIEHVPHFLIPVDMKSAQ